MKLSKQETGIIKIFSMLSVVTMHILGVAGFLPDFDRSFFQHAQEIGMSCFTFLSGYGLYMSYQKYGLSGYWEKRILKTLFPAITVNIAWALIYVPLVRPSFSRVELLSYIVCCNWYNKLNGPLWYITYIFLWYLVFWLVFKLCPQYKLLQVACLGGINLLIGLVIPSGIAGANYFIFQFTLGVIAACFLLNIKRKYVWLVCIPLAAAWWYLSVMSNTEGNILSYNMGIMAGTVLFLLLFKQLFIKDSIFERFIAWGGAMGELSLYLYLLHDPMILEPCRQGIINNLLTLIIALAIWISLSIIWKKALNRVIERIHES